MRTVNFTTKPLFTAGDESVDLLSKQIQCQALVSKVLAPWIARAEEKGVAESAKFGVMTGEARQRGDLILRRSIDSKEKSDMVLHKAMEPALIDDEMIIRAHMRRKGEGDGSCRGPLRKKSV